MIFRDAQFRKKGEQDRTIEFILSDSSVDAYNTIIPVSEWKLDRFNSNGVVFYQHGGWESVDPNIIIGKGRAWIEGEQLIGEVEFEPAEINPLAETIYKKLLFGSLKGVSVGFDAEGGEYRDINGKEVFVFKGCELYEFSVVNIPANKNALKRFIEEHTKEVVEETIEANEETIEVIEQEVEDHSEYDTLLINNAENLLK